MTSLNKSVYNLPWYSMTLIHAWIQRVELAVQNHLEKLQSYPAKIQCQVMIGPPVKRHFRWRENNGPLCFLGIGKIS